MHAGGDAAPAAAPASSAGVDREASRAGRGALDVGDQGGGADGRRQGLGRRRRPTGRSRCSWRRRCRSRPPARPRVPRSTCDPRRLGPIGGRRRRPVGRRLAPVVARDHQPGDAQGEHRHHGDEDDHRQRGRAGTGRSGPGAARRHRLGCDLARRGPRAPRRSAASTPGWAGMSAWPPDRRGRPRLRLAPARQPGRELACVGAAGGVASAVSAWRAGRYGAGPSGRSS